MAEKLLNVLHFYLIRLLTLDTGTILKTRNLQLEKKTSFLPKKLHPLM